MAPLYSVIRYSSRESSRRAKSQFLNSLNGHERDFLMASAKATFDAIETLPDFYGARHGAGHTATVDHPGGGEWANVASNWLRWQLKNDKQVAETFVGGDCSLCTNPNWDTTSKRLQ